MVPGGGLRAVSRAQAGARSCLAVPAPRPCLLVAAPQIPCSWSGPGASVRLVPGTRSDPQTQVCRCGMCPRCFSRSCASSCVHIRQGGDDQRGEAQGRVAGRWLGWHPNPGFPHRGRRRLPRRMSLRFSSRCQQRPWEASARLEPPGGRGPRRPVEG